MAKEYVPQHLVPRLIELARVGLKEIVSREPHIGNAMMEEAAVLETMVRKTISQTRKP